MEMSSAKLVCSQDRRPKAMAISTPIPIRCFIGTLRTRQILRLWRAKRNMSGLPTNRDLAQNRDRFGYMETQMSRGILLASLVLTLSMLLAPGSTSEQDLPAKVPQSGKTVAEKQLRMTGHVLARI